jgi:hypothetical protein
MQNGSHSNTGGPAGSPVLRTSGGLGTLVDDVGAQDGVGHGSTLVKSDAAIRRRSDRRSSSISDRLPGSGGVGHNLPDTAKEVGVEGMAGSGARGSLSGLRSGPGSLSYASSADSRDHETHRRGQRDPSSICIEARAEAVHSHEEWEGNRGAGGPGDRIQRQQTDAIRAWTRLHLHGVSLHHTRLPNSIGTGLSEDTNLANEDGMRDTIPAVMRAARVKAERDEELEEASGGIPDGALPTPALRRR